MSATVNDFDDGITQDAIPSPPRDQNKEKITTQVNLDEEEEVINARPKHNGSYPKKTKTRKNINHPTSVATVINIKDASGIHIGSNYNVFMNNKSDKAQQRNKEFIVTDAIKVMFTSSSAVSREQILFISPHFNEHWRDTARSLNYSDGQISQFYEDYIRSGIKEVIYQFLLDWIQNEPEEATVGKLSTVLWENNQKEVVSRWSENFVSSSK